jgi:inner membrane protein
MASLFTHALVGTALGQAGASDWRKDWRFWGLIIVCSILPDIDSIGFLMGVPYESLWGHRGITHSLIFAAILALCLSTPFSSVFRRPLVLAVLLFVVTASHGILVR